MGIHDSSLRTARFPSVHIRFWCRAREAYNLLTSFGCRGTLKHLIPGFTLLLRKIQTFYGDSFYYIFGTEKPTKTVKITRWKGFSFLLVIIGENVRSEIREGSLAGKGLGGLYGFHDVVEKISMQLTDDSTSEREREREKEREREWVREREWLKDREREWERERERKGKRMSVCERERER